MKNFSCQSCGQTILLENTRCETCGRQLGFLPQRQEITGATGHRDGVITLSIEEADDATREKNRTAMGEP